MHAFCRTSHRPSIKHFWFRTNYQLSPFEIDTVFEQLISWLLTQDICQSNFNQTIEKLSIHTRCWREKNVTHNTHISNDWTLKKEVEQLPNGCIEKKDSNGGGNGIISTHWIKKSFAIWWDKKRFFNETDNYVYDFNFSGTSHHYQRCNLSDSVA